ncbi:MAG: helix-turn-helix domain-containing protein [Acidimicrobiia bacterium]
MEDAGDLGRLIRESRLKKGMSLGQLASAVGRTSSSVRRWERGEVPPAKAIIPDLAAALDLEPSELDALRPGPSLPEPIEPDSIVADPAEAKPTTIEQPVITQSGTGTAPVAAAGAPTTEPATQPPAPAGEGMFEELAAAYRAVTEDWSGWIRGALTTVVLLAMLLVLLWAASELFSALGEIWDSFDAESTP